MRRECDSCDSLMSMSHICDHNMSVVAIRACVPICSALGIAMIVFCPLLIVVRCSFGSAYPYRAACDVYFSRRK